MGCDNYTPMIKSFKCKKTEQLFQRSQIAPEWRQIASVALRKLSYLHAANRLADLRIPPANKLEKLKGNRKGQYSIRINRKWRVCFEFKDGNAYNVEIVDYH
jgi:proteic killer suppression protein